jgi:hypothetical protein
MHFDNTSTPAGAYLCAPALKNSLQDMQIMGLIPGSVGECWKPNLKLMNCTFFTERLYLQRVIDMAHDSFAAESRLSLILQAASRLADSPLPQEAHHGSSAGIQHRGERPVGPPSTECG